ncbi:NUDIX domain-containing protein [Mesorhizobium xinjiangense]|uniref:NUDIX domain-containing protein n=1 Tax=Mesorhizobium xinjiangense TaxID=2678685 RepID=UPI0012EEDB4E|nr:NUDIX domain-containing protein [Mesorhizobium xinjiangense]
MTRKSAGILPYRLRFGDVQVLLVHPGGPFWRNRGEEACSIAKGEYADSEHPESAARREFTEETGWEAIGALSPLGEIRQAGGKYVTAFALNADFDPQTLSSNAFELEWPPNSGRMQVFPEVDRAEWFGFEKAREKIIAGQRPFLERLYVLCRDEHC